MDSSPTYDELKERVQSLEKVVYMKTEQSLVERLDRLEADHARVCLQAESIKFLATRLETLEKKVGHVSMGSYSLSETSVNLLEWSSRMISRVDTLEGVVAAEAALRRK